MPVIPNSNQYTSKIGFGTAGVMGSAFSDRGRLKLLDLTYSLGVTHFDTAPLYGMGEAESLLGKFIQNKRSSLTIATKFGLNPPPLAGYQRLALPVVRYLNRRFPKVGQYIHQNRASQNVKTGTNTSVSKPQSPNLQPYKVEELEKSLDNSLRKLRSDYVDIYLLHECKLEHIHDDVLAKLEDLICAGKIVSYGLATGKSESSKILNQYPSFKGCVQIGHNVVDSNLRSINTSNNLLTIIHSVLLPLCSNLNAYFLRDKQALKKWSSELNYDLGKDDAIAKFLLLLSVQQNENGIVLFSSSKLVNIESNLKAINAEDISTEQIEIFRDLISNDAQKL